MHEGSDEQALQALLQASGIDRTPEEVDALVRAVAAAPPGHDPDAWLDLIAPPDALALRDRLRRMKALALARQPAEPPVAERLDRLRQRLQVAGVDGFVLPLTDEHGSEYLPGAARRLTWLTGFTGSAGCLVILPKRAALFVDGRYTLQAEAELDPSLYERRHVTEEPPEKWIRANLEPGQRLGYDPALHLKKGIERLAKAAARAGGTLEALAANPVDQVWDTRPPLPVAPVEQLDDRFTGESSEAKRARMGQLVAEAGADVSVLTAPDSIAWLLNIRGGDVPYNPLALCFALLHADGAVELFIDQRKLKPGQHLGNGVSVQPVERFEQALQELGTSGRAVLADPQVVNAGIILRLGDAGARLIEAGEPCVGAKAEKNPVELAGARNAQQRDGAAMVRFLAWLERAAAGGAVTELSAAGRLVDERAKDPLFRGESFPAISGAGANGAIVHYRVTPESDRRLEPGSLYLIDSGGQYLDATTDVTRTVAIGAASDEMRRHFTLVLKGHIRIARAVFPAGTTGAQLDVLARQALWNAGLDYDHGTGHGVGAYLCVHEGPARISKRGGEATLKPGMILSNEPGYYRSGAYGIRIENLIAVTRRGRPAGGERDLLGFETLSRVPIDRRLVRTDLLAAGELAWLNNYHARVRADLVDLLEADTRTWLVQATQPL